MIYEIDFILQQHNAPVLHLLRAHRFNKILFGRGPDLRDAIIARLHPPCISHNIVRRTVDRAALYVSSELTVVVLPFALRCDGLDRIPMLDDLAICNAKQIVEG